MTAPHLLDPPALHAFALTLAERDHREHHWSTQAIVLGRVQDEGLFTSEAFGKYATARAWAYEQLHLPTERFRVVVEKLWPMMKRCRAEVSFPAWAQVPQTRALLLAKVLAVPGVEVKPWFDAAGVLPSGEFKQKIAALLQEPAWTTWRCRIPVTLEPLLDEMLRRVLPDVLDSPHADPERVKDRDVKFRCLEIAAAHVLASYVPEKNDPSVLVANA